MDTQITIEELIDSYQKEIGTLTHNKIMSSIQIKNLSNKIKILEEQNNQLSSELEKFKSNKKSKVMN